MRTDRLEINQDIAISYRIDLKLRGGIRCSGVVVTAANTKTSQRKNKDNDELRMQDNLI